MIPQKNKEELMPIRKILLKDGAGAPCGAVTVTFGERGCAVLPQGFRLLAAESAGRFLSATGERLQLPHDASDLSLLGEYHGKSLFASTLSQEKATFARWRLMRSQEENSPLILPKSPLQEEDCQVKESTLPAEEVPEESSEENLLPKEDFDGNEEDLSEKFSLVEIANELQESPLEKAERLLSTGEAFPLFEEMMPNSRWAKIKEEECEYLVGILEEEGASRVLYGIAGSRDYPPDEDRLWTFFPLDEEDGYYLTEAELL